METIKADGEVHIDPLGKEGIFHDQNIYIGSNHYPDAATSCPHVHIVDNGGCSCRAVYDLPEQYRFSSASIRTTEDLTICSADIEGVVAVPVCRGDYGGDCKFMTKLGRRPCPATIRRLVDDVIVTSSRFMDTGKQGAVSGLGY